MEKKLRPYQQEAHDAIFKSLEKGCHKMICVLPTGGGKTLLAAKVAKGFKKILFMSHTEELISQSGAALLNEFYPEINVNDIVANYGDLIEYQRYLLKGGMFTKEEREKFGIIKADLFNIDAHITLASFQTLHRRLDRIPADIFDLIIIDECHRAGSVTTFKSLSYFKPDLLLGISATPFRADGMLLGDIFDEIVYQYNIIDAINEGYLCELDAIQVKTQLSLDNVRTTAGELNQRDLKETVDTPVRNQLIVQKYKEFAEGLQAITFCVDVEHAQNVCKEFKEAGYKSEFIVGDETLSPDRKQIIERFKSGQTQVLSNVMVLCLDSQTEILTSDGFVDIDSMTYDHKVANWDNGKIFFDTPKDIVRRDRMPNESMVSMTSRVKNIRVTSNHKMVWKNNIQKKWRKDDAIKLVGKAGFNFPVAGIAEPEKMFLQKPFVYSEKQYKRAISANSFNLRKFNGFNMKDSIEESKKRLDRKINLKFKDPHELTLDECKLIGFWTGDGSKYINSDGQLSYSLCQSLANPNIIKWIDRILKKVKIHFIKRKRPPAFNSYAPGVGSFIWELCRGTGFGPQERNGIFSIMPYLNKSAPYIEYFNIKQFHAFLEGFWFADGNHRQNRKMQSTKQVIYNSNIYLLNKLQAVASCRDYRTSLYKLHKPKKDHHAQMWGLSFRKYNVFRVGQERFKLESEYKEERVWCVRSTSGNIVTRRNGHVSVVGNSEGFDHPGIGVIIMGCPTKSMTKFYQQIGRATRTLPGVIDGLETAAERKAAIARSAKKKAIVIDIVDITTKHRLINTFELDRAKPIEERVFTTSEKKEVLIEARKKREFEANKKKDARVNLFEIPKVKYSSSIKMQEEATPRQLEIIKEKGYDVENIHYTKMMASEIISNLPVSDKQVSFLKWQVKKFGMHMEVDATVGLTYGEFQLAMKKIEEMQAKRLEEKRKTVQSEQLDIDDDPF